MVSDLDNKLSDQFYRSSEDPRNSRKSQPDARENLPIPRETICVTSYKEKYFEKPAFFRSPKNMSLTTTKTPQTDHENTTKNHHENTHFSQNPLQKHSFALRKLFSGN